jgi:hypothetical protein
MVHIANRLNPMEIEIRAAKVRSQWSPAERLRRTGLPPDAPPRLRELILADRQPGWEIMSLDR